MRNGVKQAVRFYRLRYQYHVSYYIMYVHRFQYNLRVFNIMDFCLP